MIVSALLTSLGINSGLCVLFFTLYSILRKQPGNSYVYIPRRPPVEKGFERSNHFLQRLIPTPTWVRTAWKLSEEELLSTSGLDAVVFIRIITFSLKVFLFTGALGLLVLLPIHASGTHIATFVIADISSVTLDLFTISNVNNSSKCISKSVDSFFTKYYPSTYLSHVVIHRTNSHWHLVEVRSAFVFFRSRYGATNASQSQQSENPTEWVTEKAPDPDDVYWPFFESSFLKRWLLRVVIIVTYILVTILFILPVLLVQGLTNLSQLEVLFPFLQGILSMKYIGQIVTGYLPNLILQLFILLIPPVMEFLSSIQGHFSHSEIQRSACSKFLWFMIWNIFFANVLSGSVFTQLSDLLDLKNIPSKLAVSVPAQFINVYSPKFETAGKFWPIVHNSMIFALLLMHSIALGIFTLKKLRKGSTLIIPLPVMTLLFNEYCRKRFLPNFTAFSVESLITRDREDANDHEMPQFFDQLITAYKDPASSPELMSSNDGLRVPNHSDDLTDAFLASV
ncbi:hypothetical protein KSS87_013747 [Heliosperma pusillum]|nr:hypothetical protein KSS87_013747 [Heliosperma pusillum]